MPNHIFPMGLTQYQGMNNQWSDVDDQDRIYCLRCGRQMGMGKSLPALCSRCAKETPKIHPNWKKPQERDGRGVGAEGGGGIVTTEEKRTALKAIGISAMVDECRKQAVTTLAYWSEIDEIAQLLDSAAGIIAIGAMNRIAGPESARADQARATDDATGGG